MRHVAQAKGHTDHGKMVIWKRQLLRGTHHCGQRNPGVQQSVTTGAQHGFIDVCVHHLPTVAYFFGKGHGQVARAACDVQHRVALLHIGNQHGEGLPCPMQPPRHQVVHDVIFGRNRVKYAAHMARLVGLIDRLVTKMGAGHG